MIIEREEGEIEQRKYEKGYIVVNDVMTLIPGIKTFNNKVSNAVD